VRDAINLPAIGWCLTPGRGSSCGRGVCVRLGRVVWLVATLSGLVWLGSWIGHSPRRVLGEEASGSGGYTVEDPFPDIVASIRQSVVAVGSYSRKDHPSVVYAGTGFVVDYGLTIVTNAHVADAIRKRDRVDQLRVFFPDPDNLRKIRGRPATVLAEDTFHDVALLRIEGPAANALSLKLPIGEDQPRQGQAVAVMGYPVGLLLGLVPAVHRGVISAVVPAVLPLPRGAKMTPQLAAAIRKPYNLYQLDLVVFPGNSGSPLIDVRDGRVIGIINKTLANKTREHLLTHPTGISYAVPVHWVHELILRSTFATDKGR